ncbi:MAG: M48 family metalloprotease [Gammaproteobacteria bacterium]|nr:M48 family metalloprotease [Gammaproteobacteria bacterium]
MAVVVVALGVLFWVLGLAADYLVTKVPFSYEQDLAENLVPVESSGGELPDYLQELTRRLVEVMALPAGMTVRIHYVNDPTVNAFATLGGHLVINRGLLERLPNENALAMVLAHEIAHAQLRHPLRSLGRGVVLAVVVSALSGAGGNTLINDIVGGSGILTALSFSRDQEQAADILGLNALIALYGHCSGSRELFQLLLEEEKNTSLGAPPVEFLRTHPLGEERIEVIDSFACDAHQPLPAEMTPLPSFVPSKSAPSR